MKTPSKYTLLLAQLLDPDDAEPTDARACNQRFVIIGRLRNGVHPLRGNLLPEVAAQLQLIIDAQCHQKSDGPPEPDVKFRSESEGAEPAVGAAATEADPWNPGPAQRDRSARR